MRSMLPIALVAAPVSAANLDVTVEIPQLKVAEYHRPYVAIWIEQPGKGVVSNLAVWYDVKLKDKEGEKWLKDMRQWWRRIGRELQFPIDGVTGATRAPGKHQLTFAAGKAPLQGLAPGKYEIVVEAAREVGGRELLRTSFEWPLTRALDVSTPGATELVSVTLHATP